MITLDRQALSMILHMAQEPIIVVSEQFIITEMNHCAEKAFKKNQLLNSPLSRFCSVEEQNKLTSHTLEQINLLLKNEKFSCFALLISDEPHDAITRDHFKEREHLPKHSGSNPNHSKNTFDFLESIISAIPVSVYWMNTDYVYLGCSNSMAVLLNLPSRQDIIGKTYADLYDKKSAAFYRKSDKAVIEKGISLSLEEPLFQPDGTKLIYLSKKVPLHNNKGEIIGMLGISTNITQRKEMEVDLKLAKEAAEAADRAKTEFIANMGHDIRTPLSGVIGMAELLENSLIDVAHKAEAHIIHDSGEELLSLLNDILDDVKAGNINDGELHPTPFDLYQCIDDLIKLERPTTTAKHLGLNLEMDKSIPRTIISDRKKIQRILLNLLGNAIKFTHSGQITVNIKCLERKNETIKIQFSVSDTGIGIPQEFQDKVFDRFFRYTPSFKGIYKGHGLGLHIARTYVQLLGGQISLVSKEGVGSTFQFDLECNIAKEDLFLQLSQKIADPVSPLTSQKTSALPCCLLVEDNLTALMVLESIVTKAGCIYLSATNGEDAFNLIKVHHFDLILTDIGLPGISGTEFSSLVREWEKEHNKTPQPIIGLTGHARDAAYTECITSGMNDVYTKPANLDLIKTLIDTYFATSAKPQVLKHLETEKELEHFALFHPEEGIISCGNNKSLFRDMLHLLISKEIPSDLEQMKYALSKDDWSSIEKLAHKMKGSSVYLGLIRMQHACQYIELYLKSGQRDLLDKLYQQTIHTINATSVYIKKWLENNPL